MCTAATHFLITSAKLNCQLKLPLVWTCWSRFKVNGMTRILDFFSTVPFRSIARRYSVKKMCLDISQNSQENNCARVSFVIKLQASGLLLYIKKETLSQLFSCESCETSKNTFFTEHLRVTDSNLWKSKWSGYCLQTFLNLR